MLPQENSFPVACRQTLTLFLLAVSNHLSRKRPADTFLDFLTNSSSIVIVFLSELSNAIRTAGSSSNAPEAIRLFLEANQGSSLANVLDVDQQNRKLKAVAQDILHTFLDRKAYNCEPVQVFLREILGSLILDMTVNSCSRAEFINEWIIYGLEGDTELLQAIDAGVSHASANRDSQSSGKHMDNAVSISSQELYESPEAGSQARSEHKRTVSRAEDAMDEAMQEAKRLSELIAAEEAKKGQASVHSTSSGDTSAADAAPTSSGDDLPAMMNESSSEIVSEEELSADSELKIARTSPTSTTFDQIISSQQPTALKSQHDYVVPALTLHNASVSIFDDSVPGEKGIVRSKPTVDYLLQIEPATSQHPGWMIVRKYPDFETLHEVLRRISVISGVAAFAEKYQNLPAWKGMTKDILRHDLEQYLRTALSFQRLAESEGMKRFLEKDHDLGHSSPNANKSGFGFPTPAAFETMGKGMLDVLTGAPKGAAGGGKAILGGVTGVLGGVGNLGQRKQTTKNPLPRSNNGSVASLPRIDSDESGRSSFALGRESQDILRPTRDPLGEDLISPPLPRRQSQAPSNHPLEQEPNGIFPGQPAPSTDVLKDHPSQNCTDELHLPPPPSEITDDYRYGQGPSRPSVSNDDTSTFRTPTSTATSVQKSSSRKSPISSLQPTDQSTPPSSTPAKPNRPAAVPLTSQETSVAVELFFATINELYTLSSAWTLRLTLLNAAKSFLLRGGNPNLEAIRVLLQDIISANTSDSGIATHITKLRENSLPTEEELKSWPSPPSDEEKERRRVKARKLLVEKGMPQALTSVMGAAASGEALGRVFDCLQVPEVARGLVFALILQGVKAVTQ